MWISSIHGGSQYHPNLSTNWGGFSKLNYYILYEFYYKLFQIIVIETHIT